MILHFGCLACRVRLHLDFKPRVCLLCLSKKLVPIVLRTEADGSLTEVLAVQRDEQALFKTSSRRP